MAPSSPTLSFTAVQEIAASCQMLDVAEVETALLYFHELGYFVFYSDPTLRHLVVLEPQWIVNCISAIIRDHREQKGKKALHAMEVGLQTYQQFGSLREGGKGGWCIDMIFYVLYMQQWFFR